MTEDADALAFIKGLGYQAAPVVYTQGPVDPETDSWETRHWSGNQPDRIKAIVK